MTCPSCQQKMTVHDRSGIPVAQCESCRGIFLQRSSVADLVDAETSWHGSTGQYTQPLPRITADMTEPPRVTGSLAKRSFLETLFG